ncbi:MAG: hypothetical protein ABR511_04055 [Acidimicrobiales bacterium]
MGRRAITPLGAVLRGALAATAGTVAMDLVWYARYRKGGGEDSFRSWERSGSTLTWDEAAAPAQVGRRVLEGFLQRPLPESWAGPTNNVVHWSYGVMWGSVYGLLAGSAARPKLRWGPPFAVVVWGSGYVVLPLAGLYKPIWEYDATTLAKDLSAHLAFGTATAAAFRALAGRRA